MKLRRRVPLTLIMLLCIASRAYALPQESQKHGDRLSTAHDFLRDLYPRLNNKNYSLSVEIKVSHDHYADPDFLRVYVGNGFPHEIIGHGSCGPVFFDWQLPPVVPPPPELAPSPPRPSFNAPPTGPTPNMENCPAVPGPIHPKVVLTAGFRFDDHGRLSQFSASEETASGYSDADQRFASFVITHPEYTDEQLVAELRKRGAKYGPDDKQEFLKNLPIAQLERYMGKLKILSAEHDSLHDARSDSSWPGDLFWQVRVSAKRSDGTQALYKMRFDQFQGELHSIQKLKQ